MRVLVIGGSGLLGTKVVEVLASRGHTVVATYNRTQPAIRREGVSWVRLDLLERTRVEDLILKTRPDTVIHLAAYTDVDGCEVNRDYAWRVNVEGTKSVVRAVRVTKSHLVYISTDYVFDGERGMYREDDVPNPINFYGLTKLVAENIVSTSDVLYTIVRTSAIYGLGPGKKSFATYVIEHLKRGEEVKALVDQFVSPTHSLDLAHAIAQIIEAKPMGTLHVAGPRMSRYDFAIRIARVFGLDENLIKPAKMSDMKWIAKRPRDSSLDTTRAKTLLGIDLSNIDKSLKDLLNEYQQSNNA